MAVAKKRRRKKRRYKTGTYKSPKCKTPIEYRSGWELEVCKYLDLDPSVLEYGYECMTIEYVSNVRTGKVRSYYPDFLITYKDGTRKLVEVKRKDKLNDPKVVKKAKAAEIWAKANGVRYEFWTNTIIEAFRKINEAHNPSPPKPKPKKRRRRPAAK
jgi:hypothetical protein